MQEETVSQRIERLGKVVEQRRNTPGFGQNDVLSLVEQEFKITPARDRKALIREAAEAGLIDQHIELKTDMLVNLANILGMNDFNGMHSHELLRRLGAEQVAPYIDMGSVRVFVRLFEVKDLELLPKEIASYAKRKYLESDLGL